MRHRPDTSDADLIKGHVLLGEDGAVIVLAFAVANRFPRWQELAMPRT